MCVCVKLTNKIFYLVYLTNHDRNKSITVIFSYDKNVSNGALHNDQNSQTHFLFSSPLVPIIDPIKMFSITLILLFPILLLVRSIGRTIFFTRRKKKKVKKPHGFVYLKQCHWTGIFLCSLTRLIIFLLKLY